MGLFDTLRGAVADTIGSWLGGAVKEHPLGSTGVEPVKDAETAPKDSRAQVAPWPQIDRYPVVRGSSITLSLVSAEFRLAQTGYRQTYVDLLRELIERDPHAYAVVQQRILTVAGARLEISPASCAPDEEGLAKEIADECRRKVEAIPSFNQACAQLLWAIYFGPCAQEITWARDGNEWTPVKLHFVHSRRLAFPDPTSWNLHVWDLGLVQWNEINAPTRGMFGVPVDAYPGKFIVHTPCLNGDYPTRDGLGRELAYWMVLKAMAARNAAHYVERFGKPWPLAFYNVAEDGTDKPRSANEDDVEKADLAMRALGDGSLAGATLPNSISVQLEGPGVKQGRLAITQDQFITICDAQMSKAVQGQTFTTETGKFGSRSTADVGESNVLRIAAYDAACFAETIRRDLVAWIVRLNYPGKQHLVPDVSVHVEDEPDAKERMAIAFQAAGVGMPIDADELAKELGYKLVPHPGDELDADGNVTGERKHRRLAPVKQVDPAELDRLDDPEAREEDEAQAEEAVKAAAEMAKNAPPGAQAPPGTTNGQPGALPTPPKANGVQGAPAQKLAPEGLPS